MLDDYIWLIDEGAVSVLDAPDGAIAALIVLLAKSDICCSTMSRSARTIRVEESGVR